VTKIVPTVGRVVLYTLNESDVRHVLRQYGLIGFSGYGPNVGDILPANVVKVWGDTPESCVNLKVQLDGPGDFWATSRMVEADRCDDATGKPLHTPGYYHWMGYQLGQAKKHEEVKIELKAGDMMKTTTKTTVTG
jgi:hypothetical protein